MSKSIDEDIIVKKSKAAFESSLTGVDQDTLARLALARRAALDAVPNTASDKSRSFYWGWGSGVIAACLLVAVIGFYPANQEFDDSVASNDFLMVEIIETDDIELLEHDAEFYEWLEKEGVI